MCFYKPNLIEKEQVEERSCEMKGQHEKSYEILEIGQITQN